MYISHSDKIKQSCQRGFRRLNIVFAKLLKWILHHIIFQVNTVIQRIAVQLYCGTSFLRILSVMIMESELNIKHLMSINNRSKYWLTKKLATDSRFVTKLIENETTSISFEMIGKLCDIFDCTVDELIILKEPKKQSL